MVNDETKKAPTPRGCGNEGADANSEQHEADIADYSSIENGIDKDYSGLCPDEQSFLCTIDLHHKYKVKPNNAIATNNIKNYGVAVRLTASQFCKSIKAGCTFIGSTLIRPYEGAKLGIARAEAEPLFLGQQVFAIDIDNKIALVDANGKKLKDENNKLIEKVLHEGDEGFLSPCDALDRCYSLGLQPLCLYFTFSATLDHPRFRIVFVIPELMRTIEEAEIVASNLLSVFPEADKVCKNFNRMFHGSMGEVWECWKV